MTRTMAILVLAGAVAAAACSDSEEMSGPTETPNDAGSSGTPTGSIPTFDLDGGGGIAPPANDGALPTFDFDAAITPAPPLPPNQRAVWAADENRHLVRILADNPTSVIDVAPLLFPGGLTEQVVGMDFRPSNGMLYVLTTASRLYTVDRTTAKATPVGAEPTSPLLAGQAYGVDFNPVADLLRVHSDVDQNLRINPTTGVVAGTDMSLAFGASDENFGQSPNLIGSAYTNSIAGAASTTLYAIDSTRNLLTKVDPPNTGTVTTVGPLGLDIIAHAGFDIWGADGSSLVAYAALRVQGSAGTGLYKIDLNSGAATLVGEIVHQSPLRGIAIEP